jgi:hypothetical protein
MSATNTGEIRMSSSVITRSFDLIVLPVISAPGVWYAAVVLPIARELRRLAGADGAHDLLVEEDGLIVEVREHFTREDLQPQCIDCTCGFDLTDAGGSGVSHLVVLQCEI